MSEIQNVFELYQKFTPTTALYPGNNTGNKEEVIYLGLGLMGELTEWFESGYDMAEAGDLFWYMSQLCNVYKWDLYEVVKEVDRDYQFVKVNFPEALKKHWRDGKDITDLVYKYIEYVISHIKQRYSYSMNNPNLDETLVYILIQNREKLIDRQNRSVLHGDGDNR